MINYIIKCNAFCANNKAVNITALKNELLDLKENLEKANIIHMLGLKGLRQIRLIKYL